jgi:chemotaxis protein MotB
MGRSNIQQESDEAAGAPEWMVTFSDCMTLLLTFFVLLLSFSSFDERIFEQLRVIFAKAMPVVTQKVERDRDAFLPTKLIQSLRELDEGSEKPTLERGFEERSKEDTEPANYHSRKVFLISSNKIFFGRGISISSEGNKVLTTVGDFLNKVPGQVVISENGAPEDSKDNEDLGLLRAWVVMNHLTKQNIDKNRFSISATSTLVQEGVQGNELSFSRPETGRILEVVLLERSIYN